MATNIFYSDGTMSNSSIIDTQTDKIPLEGITTWNSDTVKAGEVFCMLNKNNYGFEMYSSVMSNFHEGFTNGYTHVDKSIVYNGKYEQITIEEGIHIRGKKVGRISTKTTYLHTNETTIDYNDFDNDCLNGSSSDVNEICFYNMGTRVGYQYVSYEETIAYCGKIYLTNRNDSVVKFNDDEQYLYVRKVYRDGTIVINNIEYHYSGIADVAIGII